MGGGTIEIEIALGVSDETAAACVVILNHYLRSHPGMEVDISTVEGVGDTLTREIRLRKEAEP
jgi:hypothetical protein